MKQVEFNVVSEFIEELRKDAPKIDRNIVRCTNVFRWKVHPNIRDVYIKAGYICENYLVELYRFCGQVWGSPNDEEVDKHAEKMQEEIKAVCDELGLEIRAGTFRTEKPSR